ncbi:MAG: S8 family peptidase, partial [Chloroflexota bacterium]
MKTAPLRRLLITAAVTVAVAVPMLGSGVDARGSFGRPAAPGTVRTKNASDAILVQFVEGFQPAVRARALGAVENGRVSRQAGRLVRYRFPSRAAAVAALESLRGDPTVVFAEPDYRVEAVGKRNGRRAIGPADVSNDPKLTDGTLWGMLSGTSSPANQYGTGAIDAWARGYIGSRNVYIGVIDTGVQVTHPDLAANMWTNPYDPVDGRDNDSNGYIDDVNGWDFYYGDRSVYDSTSDDHGTHVAGTIGGVGQNGVGVAGVSWRVTMISAKFLGPQGGYTSDAIRAVDYFTDLKTRHGLNIVATSNSWGGGGASAALLDAIERGGDQGILFVAAAGNSNVNTDASPHYPSAYRCNLTASGASRGWDCVISVASITSSGARSSFSNYGATSVDLGAPGSSIYSTVPSNTYASYSGTSMATPHVSGAIALCAALDPSLSAQSIRSNVMSTATATTSMSGVTVTGGRLDAAALAASCAPSNPTPTTNPTPVPTVAPTPVPTVAPT